MRQFVKNSYGKHCFEPEEPELDTFSCTAVGVGGNHSDSYSEDGEWRCDWCGARPRLPVLRCGKKVFGRTCDVPCTVIGGSL